MNKNKLSIYLLLLIPMSLLAQDEEYVGASEEDVYINLEYTGCHRGSFCPWYEITILSNGMVIFEGTNDVSKTGVVQTQINKQKVADLLTKILAFRYFERKDESSHCGAPKVELIGGNYDFQGGRICITSSHGPFTDINVQLGTLKRKVQLEHYFSNDYKVIHQEIIATAGVQEFIGNKKSLN